MGEQEVGAGWLGHTNSMAWCTSYADQQGLLVVNKIENMSKRTGGKEIGKAKKVEN